MGIDSWNGDKTRMHLQERDRIACGRMAPRQERYQYL